MFAKELAFVKSVAGILMFLALATPLAAEKLPVTDQIPAISTSDQKVLIDQGIALHEAGDFASAIALYEQVLAASPTVVDAMYELALSHAAMKDYAKAMDIARKGAQYRSESLPWFHLLIGNCLDDLGSRSEAIDVYKSAIKRTPDFGLLHYSLGLTYIRIGKLEDARKALRHSLYRNPNHASSHYLLSVIYQQLGYRVPALLGFSRFLLIEPNGPRTEEVLTRLNTLLGDGVSRNGNANGFTIVVSMSSRENKDEGDFDSVALGMSIGLAAAQIASEKNESNPFKRVSSNYAVMSEILARPEGKGFAVEYYAPFFAELDKQGFVEAFVYHAFSGAHFDGAHKWAEENPAKIADFQKWTSEYRWPSK
jgi:tetratricopeptide (TPR) repeat protein